MFFTGDSLCGVSGFFNFFEKDVRKSVYGRDRNGQRGAPYVRYISDGKPCSGVRGSQQASTDLSWAKFTHFFMGNVADTAVSQIQTKREYDIMKKTNVQKLVIAGILCAVAACIRQQMRPCAAYGQYHLRGFARTRVRSRGRALLKPAPQFIGTWHFNGIPRKYIRRAVVRNNILEMQKDFSDAAG